MRLAKAHNPVCKSRNIVLIRRNFKIVTRPSPNMAVANIRGVARTILMIPWDRFANAVGTIFRKVFAEHSPSHNVERVTSFPAWTVSPFLVQSGNWYCFLTRICLSFQLLNLSRIQLDKELKHRQSTPALYRVASRVETAISVIIDLF